MVSLDFYYYSLVSGRGNRIGPCFCMFCLSIRLSVCQFVRVCETYVVHHFMGTEPWLTLWRHDVMWRHMTSHDCEWHQLAKGLWNAWSGRCVNAGASLSLLNTCTKLRIRSWLQCNRLSQFKGQVKNNEATQKYCIQGLYSAVMAYSYQKKWCWNVSEIWIKCIRFWAIL